MNNNMFFSQLFSEKLFCCSQKWLNQFSLIYLFWKESAETNFQHGKFQPNWLAFLKVWQSLMQVEMFLYREVKGKLTYQQCSLLRIEKDCIYIYINCFFLMFQVLWIYIALQRCSDVSDWTSYKALLEDCSDRAMGSIWYSCQFNFWRSVLHWGTWRWSYGTGMVWQKTSQEMYVHAFVLFL